MPQRRLLVLAASLVVTLAGPAIARADTVTDWRRERIERAVHRRRPAATVGSLRSWPWCTVRCTTPSTRSTAAMSRMCSPDVEVCLGVEGRSRGHRRLSRARQHRPVTASASCGSCTTPRSPQSPRRPGSGSGSGSAGGRRTAMIIARTGDGRFGTPGFPTGLLPGQWRPVLPGFVNDPAAWMRFVKPFVLQSQSQFRSAPPVRSHERRLRDRAERGQDRGLADERDADDVPDQLVPVLGGRTVCGRGTASSAPCRRREGADARGECPPLRDVRGTTVADALINVWDDKGFYLFWRPITAIREADLDLNAATTRRSELAAADRNTAVSGATPRAPRPWPARAARTLQNFFGTDNIAWTDTQPRRTDAELHARL